MGHWLWWEWPTREVSWWKFLGLILVESLWPLFWVGRSGRVVVDHGGSWVFFVF